jgi:hypothetical protein
MEDVIVEATPDKKKKGRPAKVKAEPTVDMDLVKELILQMQAGNTEQLKQLAAELRKPTDLEQKKLDDERAALIRRQQQSVTAAKQQAAIVAANQAACAAEGHANERGGTRFRGQVNSNGYWIPVCMKCGLQGKPVKATSDEAASGVMLGQWKGINYESLLALAESRERA